jgi:hypothetical protein
LIAEVSGGLPFVSGAQKLAKGVGRARVKENKVLSYTLSEVETQSRSERDRWIFYETNQNGSADKQILR